MVIYEKERSNGIEYIYNQDDENLNFQKHVHYSFEVIFVLDGELVCEVENEEHMLKKGEALMILPWQIHSYKTATYSKSYLCVFSNDLVSSFYNTIKYKKFGNPKFKTNKDFINTLKSDCDIFSKQSCLYNICSEVYNQCDLTQSHNKDTKIASTIAYYVQNNYTENISLKKIAKEYGYNYTYLSSFFHSKFGDNFSVYVNEFRLQYAISLLNSTDKNITEIASESGFSTIRNFNTAFKNEYGISPREYRKTGS